MRTAEQIPPEVRESITGLIEWLKPSLYRRMLGRARRLRWAIRNWWRGPVQTYRVGDVISIADKHPTIARIEGRKLIMSDGSELTVS